MKKTTGFYPRVRVDAAPMAAAGSAGGVLLTQTVRAAGPDVALSQMLDRWRSPAAVRDPAKILTDLAPRSGVALQPLRTRGRAKLAAAMVAHLTLVSDDPPAVDQEPAVSA